MDVKHLKRKGISLLLALVLLTGLILPVYAAEPPAPSELYSSAAFVMDADTEEELWSKNPDQSMVPASLTKLMTAYLVLEAIDAGQFSFDSTVPISPAVSYFSYNYNYSNVPLSTAGSYTVSQLLEAVIISSACAATQALAELVAGSEAAFVELMNDKAAELGIACHFYDCYGGAYGNRVTARGLGTLCYLIVRDHPEFLTYSKRPSFEFAGKTYQSTNYFVLGKYSCNGTVDGLKTGTTTAAGYCLTTSAYNETDRVIVVTLHSPYANRNFDDHVKLINFGLAQAGENNNIPCLDPFIDVPLGLWYTDSIEKAYLGGLMAGTSSNTFEPETLLSRAMMAQLLYNLEQKPEITPVEDTFSDVSQESWYYNAVEWAASQSLVMGRGEGVFDPDGNITRQEMVVMLHRYHLYKERAASAEGDLSRFVDRDSISDFAMPAVVWAVGDDVIHGTGNDTISPLGNASRAEVATMLMNYVGRYTG